MALLYMKNGKASGLDAMYPEFLTFSGERTRLWLSRFFTNVLQWNALPPAFKRTKIIALLKPGKPDRLPGSYRSAIDRIQALRAVIIQPNRFGNREADSSRTSRLP